MLMRMVSINASEKNVPEDAVNQAIMIMTTMIVMIKMMMMIAYILKAKKFAEPPFQSKKMRKKCG